MSERLARFVQQLQDEQIHALRAEIDRLRFTDAEREAVAKAAKDYEDSASTFYERSMHAAAREGMKQAVVMRGLLERLGGER